MAYMKNPEGEEEDQGPKGVDEKKPPTEEDLQKGLALLEAYKGKMEALGREAEMLSANLKDHSRALETLAAMKKMDQPTEMVIPVGAGVFVHVKPMTTSKVIMKIGSGVSAEYEIDPTIEKVEQKIKEMVEREQTLMGELQKLEVTAEALSQQLQSQYEAMQRARQ